MLKRLGLSLLVYLLVLLGFLGRSPVAFASIHPYPETDGQVLYRSRLSTQDVQHQAWQLILFKRIQSGQVKEFKLRLVGFPGQVVLKHPTPLSLEDSHGHHWTALDDTQNESQLESVATSVGQYDVMTFMMDFDHAERMEITVPLAGGDTRTVIVPQSMVKEWLMLKEM